MKTLLFFLTALVILSGCIAQTPPAPATLTGLEVDYQYAAALVRSGNYPDAKIVYRRIIDDTPKSSLAADAEYDLSCLHTFYDNPQKDYALALAGFEEFIKRYPYHLKVHDAQNWQAVLKTVVDANKENERLKKSIEQLKKLDIRHEERRRK